MPSSSLSASRNRAAGSSSIFLFLMLLVLLYSKMRFTNLFRLVAAMWTPTAGIEWFFFVTVVAFLTELSPDVFSFELLEESRRFRLRISLPLLIDELSLLSLGPALSYLFLVFRYVVSIRSPGRRCNISFTSPLLIALLAQSSSAVTSISYFSLALS